MVKQDGGKRIKADGAAMQWRRRGERSASSARATDLEGVPGFQRGLNGRDDWSTWRKK
ncbi:MAG: hypothetical protein JWR21_398 [Herminiimonas sp.]|nr:hypothetical protein [Herminiimonas sp.]MDB5852080.1 hypothetical protein [Herminiimonas sp.]